MTTKRLKLHLEQLLWEYFNSQTGKKEPNHLNIHYGKLVLKTKAQVIGYCGKIEMQFGDKKKEVLLKFRPSKTKSDS